MQNSKNTIYIIIIILVAVLIGVFVVNGKKGTTTGTPTETTGGDSMDNMDMTPTTPPAETPEQEEQGTVSESSDAPQNLTFTVNGGNFYFTPKTITVQKGDTVTINFKNDGGFHDFKIDEFNVATKQINGGQTDSVTFVADKVGTFEYYCSVGTHRQMGMVGTLTVK